MPRQVDGDWGCLTAKVYELGKRPDDTVRVTTMAECPWQLPSAQALTIDLGTAKVWWSGYPSLRRDVLTPAAPT